MKTTSHISRSSEDRSNRYLGYKFPTSHVVLASCSKCLRDVSDGVSLLALNFGSVLNLFRFVPFLTMLLMVDHRRSVAGRQKISSGLFSVTPVAVEDRVPPNF